MKKLSQKEELLLQDIYDRLKNLEKILIDHFQKLGVSIDDLRAVK